MSDYIKRSDILRLFQPTTNPVFNEWYERIKEIPAADVVERPVGHWERSEGEVFCSECGRLTNDVHDEVCEFDGRKAIALCLPKYCGFCGAYMRGDS